MILIERDQRLLNQYGVMLVNLAKYGHVKAIKGQTFIDGFVSPEGRRSIAELKIGRKQFFFPNAHREQDR